MEFMDVEPIDFKQMDFDTNEWAEFKKGACKDFLFFLFLKY